MSSYESTEENEDGSSHDPGVKEKEVVEEREFSTTLYSLERTDFLLLAVLLGIPAGFLTVIFLMEVFPEYQDTAGVVVRGVLDLLSELLATYPYAGGFGVAMG